MENDCPQPLPIDDAFIDTLARTAKSEVPTEIAAVLVIYRDQKTEPQIFYAPQGAARTLDLSAPLALENPPRELLRTDTFASISYRSNPQCFWYIVNGRPVLYCI